MANVKGKERVMEMMQPEQLGHEGKTFLYFQSLNQETSIGLHTREKGEGKKKSWLMSPGLSFP